MNIRPILFSTLMIEALLADKKTETRRGINWPDLKSTPDVFKYVGNSKQFDVPRPAKPYDDRVYYWFELKNNNNYSWIDVCKYGDPNDVLWVRETHYAYGHWTKITDNNTGLFKWEFKDLTLYEDKEYLFETDPPEDVARGRNTLGYHKRPAIFMPKAACRIFLRIKDVIPERLQDITEEDAIAEGIDDNYMDAHFLGGSINIANEYGFRCLWEQINGEKSWNENPWVWVIGFEKVIVESPMEFTYYIRQANRFYKAELFRL